MSHTNAHRLPKSPRLRGFLFALFAVTAQIGHAAEEWKMGDDPAVFITASPHVQFSPDGAAAEIDGKNHGWHGVLFHTDPDKVKLGKGTVVLEFDLEVLEPFDRDAWLWATLEATSTATPDLPIGKFFDKRLDPDGSNTFHLAQAGKQSHKIEISRSPDFALASGGGFRAAFGLTKQGSFTTHGAGRMRISNVRLTSTPNGKPSVVLPAPKHLAPADNARLDPRALHFLWEDNSLAERFQIEIAGEQIPGGKTSHDVPSMGADASSFIIPEGLPEGDYRWRVRSVTADGTLGDWSPEASFSVHAPGAPVPPVLALSPENPLFFFMVMDDRPLMKSFGDGSPEQEK